MIRRDVYRQPRRLTSSSAYQDNPSHKHEQMLQTLAFHKHVSPEDEKS